MPRVSSSPFPRSLWLLVAVYTVASLAHFAHNAEYIAFYPNMPAWITRETVYQAWLGVAAVGAVGVLLGLMGWPVVGAVVVAAYGALGLDGLAHYSLALCSEHTLSANLTIWLEVIAGVALMVCAGLYALRSLQKSRHARSAA
jgi:hypothetical protein